MRASFITSVPATTRTPVHQQGVASAKTELALDGLQRRDVVQHERRGDRIVDRIGQSKP